jgi:predicted N-acyltransferase
VNTSALTLALHEGVREVDAADWNRLAGGANPFMEHAWLAAMESSGAVGPGTGWAPWVVAARDASGRLVGAVPLYAKSHSFGEYIYDWAWADLAARIGTRYYPKLIVASPFSPVTGPRVLVAPDLDERTADTVFDALVDAMLDVCRQNEVAGLHLLFITEDVAARLAARGFIVRHAHQYHWRNEGYATFDDFLDRFRSKRRREIRRERRRLAEQGYRVDPVRGTELSTADLDHIFDFYASTCARHAWGRQYLDRSFFHEVHRTMPERIVVMLARDAKGDVIAGTFNLRAGDRLFGRYWGASEDVPFLHFETCYYRTIEYAIDEGIAVVEPGAGGDHKFVRGFEPVTMYSAHWIADPRLRGILDNATERESHHVDEFVERLRDASPVKKRDP